MPVTKNQALRQEIIHSMLGVSKFRLSKTELLEKINNRLSERDIKPIHWRTLNNDLNELKSQGAEIHVPSRRDPYYYYLETFYPDGTRFDEEDIDILNRGISILKKLSGFRIAKDVEGVLSRMKHTRYSEVTDYDFIAFEDHTLASGTEWLDKLAEAIQMKTVTIIEYMPFKQSSDKFTFHPYYLKEYRNRWFVLGRHHIRNCLQTLALDRILSLKPSFEHAFIINDLFDPSEYFIDMIGVSRPEGSIPETIRMIVYAESAMHVETKKIHHSQKLIRRKNDGSIELELKVIVNYELISALLGFGAAVKVIAPKLLQRRINVILQEMASHYRSL